MYSIVTCGLSFYIAVESMYKRVVLKFTRILTILPFFQRGLSAWWPSLGLLSFVSNLKIKALPCTRRFHLRIFDFKWISVSWQRWEGTRIVPPAFGPCRFLKLRHDRSPNSTLPVVAETCKQQRPVDICSNILLCTVHFAWKFTHIFQNLYIFKYYWRISSEMCI